MSARVLRVLLGLVLVGGGGVVGGPAGAAAPREAAAPIGWMDPVTLAPVGAEDVHAVVGPAGDMAVVWERAGAIETAVRPSGGDWGLPAEVVAAHDGDTPLAAYDDNGRLLVVWSVAGTSGPVRLMARVRDDTGAWGAPVRVARREAGTLRVEDLAVNASGDAVVGWLWNQRALVSRGQLDGLWTTGPGWPKTLSVDVALGDGGHGAAMLQRWVGPRTDDVTLTFEVARQTRGGVWGTPRVLQTVDQSPPWVGPGGVAVDAHGVTTVAWQRVGPGDDVVVAMRARPGRAFGGPVVLGQQPTRSEWAVRVLAAPGGQVVVAWVHNAVQGLRAVRRPAGGPWSDPAKVCAGPGLVMDWDLALAEGGAALAAVSRAAHFSAAWGTQTCSMTPAGRWSAPTQVTRAVDAPRVGISDRAAVVVWAGPPGLRARASEG